MLVTTKTRAKTTTDEKHALSSIITSPITERVGLFIWQYYLVWEFDFVQYFGAFQRERKVTISLTFASEQSFEHLEMPEH